MLAAWLLGCGWMRVVGRKAHRPAYRAGGDTCAGWDVQAVLPLLKQLVQRLQARYCFALWQRLRCAPTELYRPLSSIRLASYGRTHPRFGSI